MQEFKFCDLGVRVGGDFRDAFENLEALVFDVHRAEADGLELARRTCGQPQNGIRLRNGAGGHSSGGVRIGLNDSFHGSAFEKRREACGDFVPKPANPFQGEFQHAKPVV